MRILEHIFITAPMTIISAFIIGWTLEAMTEKEFMFYVGFVVGAFIGWLIAIIGNVQVEIDAENKKKRRRKYY